MLTRQIQIGLTIRLQITDIWNRYTVHADMKAQVNIATVYLPIAARKGEDRRS